MSNEKKLIVLDASSFGVQGSRAEQIEAVFVPMVKMLKGFESVYADVIEESEKGITPEVVAAAKRVRLDISKVRTKTDKARKEQKEEYIRGGKAIDGVANILKFAIVEKEEKLKSIETHYEKIEEERLQKVQVDREAELQQYGAENDGIDFAKMSDDVWKRYLDGYRLSYEKMIEAEKKAEEARIVAEKAEKENQQKIIEDNERLKKEAVEREQLAKIEADKQAKEKAILEKKLKAERDEREAAEKIELEKRAKEAEAREKRDQAEREEREKKEAAERAEHERILQKEREEKEKLEADIRAREDKEDREQAEKEEKEKSARLAPDKDKLLQFAAIIQGLEIPIVKNKESQVILKQVRDRLERTYLDLISQANKI